MKYKRIHLIVMDSVGIGQAPDAKDFGDEGSHTLGHIAENYDLSLPNMQKLGIGNIASLKGIAPVKNSMGYYTKLEEKSAGKDTMTGHWELMGLHIQKPFRVFPDGFPKELLQQISDYSKRGILGNKVASGTKIIEELGPEQERTGNLIIYTSADSVLQIAAHEDVIPLEELYDICEYCRKITLDDPYMIGRIIARPYIGTEGNYQRTSNRHDYALDPFGDTILDQLKAADYDVISVGKIADIFNNNGMTQAIRTKNNMDGVDKLLSVMDTDFTGLSFTNLVDFDAVYGHRRNTLGYGQTLEEFDQRIPELISKLKEDDLLMITADHGNDPTFKGTDHTREYVPILIYSPSFDHGQSLDAENFWDVAATIAENFSIDGTDNGHSFLKQLG